MVSAHADAIEEIAARNAAAAEAAKSPEAIAAKKQAEDDQEGRSEGPFHCACGTGFGTEQRRNLHAFTQRGGKHGVATEELKILGGSYVICDLKAGTVLEARALRVPNTSIWVDHSTAAEAVTVTAVINWLCLPSLKKLARWGSPSKTARARGVS